MRVTAASFPELRRVFSGYLHEDLVAEHGFGFVALHRAQQAEHVVDEMDVEVRVGSLDDVLELFGRSLIHTDERRHLPMVTRHSAQVV